ncbi:potassium voltage-gated channel subfamily H member 3-like protein [Lates japonicus]|uniref:Potassium voltage-gated channel subfamily H member 3-like protein n=1 Tax=Lates japonicus TaxID=270547 RepID=A0AAD3NC24_LATJO|nr:potassium voltage-gated channel subfamily H member 3-like protein [Lates japonicus]
MPFGRLGRPTFPLRSPLAPLPAETFRPALAITSAASLNPGELQLLQSDLSPPVRPFIDLLTGYLVLAGAHDDGDTMETIAKLKHEMSVLSRQVTAVSQELQEMTRLLKPLFHNPAALLMPSAD